MTDFFNTRMGGAKFPVALVLGLTVLTLMTSVAMDAQIANATPEIDTAANYAFGEASSDSVTKD